MQIVGPLPASPTACRVSTDTTTDTIAVGPGLRLGAKAPVFPAPESKGHVRVDVAGKWLREAERLAKDHTHEKGFGWHAFRRMWATKRKHLSSKDVAYAGGWKDTATLERVYQQPDPETTEAVVLGGRDLRMEADEDGSQDRIEEAR